MSLDVMIVPFTKGDPRIGTVITAGYEVSPTRKLVLKKNCGATHRGNGSDSVLVLFGHANISRCITDGYTTGSGSTLSFHGSEYTSGTDLVTELTDQGFQPSSFGVCLIAGCESAAATGKTGLFIQIGDALKLKVIGGTTHVRASIGTSGLDLEPINSGRWRVYYPDDDELFSLDSGRTSGLRDMIKGLGITLNG